MSYDDEYPIWSRAVYFILIAPAAIVSVIGAVMSIPALIWSFRVEAGLRRKHEIRQ